MIENKKNKSVYLRVLHTCMFIGFIIILWVLFQERDYYGFFNEQPHFLRENWTVTYGNATHEDVTLPARYEEIKEKQIKVTNRLPKIEQDGMRLAFFSRQKAADVYIDGVIRVSYNNDKTRLFGTSTASAYVIVPLFREDSGKTVEIIYSSASGKMLGKLDEVLLCEERAVYRYVIRKGLIGMILAIIVCIIGIELVLISVFSNTKGNNTKALFYLGIFALFLAFWFIMQSRMRQMYLDNQFVAAATAELMLRLLPIPFVAFFYFLIDGKYAEIFRTMSFLFTVNIVGTVALQFAGVMTLEESAIISIALIMICAIIIQGISVYEYSQTQTSQMKAMNIGALVLIIFAALEALSDNMNGKYLGQFICVGLIIFVLIMGYEEMNRLVVSTREAKVLEETTKAKTQFLANMSHEIRTPLNAICGMADVLEQKKLPTESLEYIQTIQSAANNLTGMLNNFLDYSRMESGKMEIVENEYSTMSLLQDCLKITRYRLEDKNILLREDISNLLPTALVGDSVRIRQVLTNILNNAVKYTDQGEIELVVNWERTGDDRGILRVVVKDTGRGIKEADFDKLFGAFSQVDKKRNHSIEGSGLGLAICKMLMDLMGGKIFFQSTYGVGTKFTVELPQKIADATPVGKSAKAKDKMSTEDRFLKAIDAYVMVVDDNTMNLQVAQVMLESMGFQVCTCNSGARALEILEKEQTFDIIFMDYYMPDMNGMEVSKRIRDIGSSFTDNVPIIALTAESDEEVKEKLLRAGMNDVLVKPLEMEKLCNMIRTWLPAEKMEV
ncbi:MAG: response regulator [Lachnospiraceae bacterium]|nr:response regulator [Lachnospiraceae bacterium]